MHVKTFALSLLTMGLLVSGCAAAPTVPAPIPSATTRPQNFAPELVSSPAATADQGTATAVDTATAEPFVLNFTPVPSETALPTLELPTESVHAPLLQVWDGLPTYLAESNPNYYFRLSFDPAAWALTTDAYGSPALVHRAITNCIISPTAGRDLPPNATVEHDMRKVGDITYQVSSISLNGIRQFVSYTGGDGRIFTAFQVALEERPDQCLLEAETVLATLTSVPISRATPIATP